MNRRVGKLVKIGSSDGVVLPRDWIRGHDLRAGDLLDLVYDEVVRVRPTRKRVASDAGAQLPGVPAAQPAQPAKTDGVIVSHAG